MIIPVFAKSLYFYVVFFWGGGGSSKVKNWKYIKNFFPIFYNEIHSKPMKWKTIN